MKQKFLESLPPEMRERFEAAREKALQDPGIKELRNKSETATREFMEAMRHKMQEIDPGLADYIKKQAMKSDGPGKNRGGQDKGEGMDKLSASEREQLMSARTKARTDPSVVQAKAKKDAATDPEQRRAADEEFRKAMHDAMVKGDPSMEAILKKLGPPPPPSGPQTQMDMGNN